MDSYLLGVPNLTLWRIYYSPPNILYEWWCPKCVAWHYSPYCPRDELVSNDFAGVIPEDFNYIQICPYCGQIIKEFIYPATG